MPHPWETSELLNILDTFTGADGGGRYIALQTLYAEMLRRADAGDSAAMEVVSVVHRFSRLIDVAYKAMTEGR